jgi:hypothetical protein
VRSGIDGRGFEQSSPEVTFSYLRNIILGQSINHFISLSLSLSLCLSLCLSLYINLSIYLSLSLSFFISLSLSLSFFLSLSLSLSLVQVIESVLDHIDGRFGSVENWLIRNGFSLEDQNKLAEKYTVLA